MTCSDEAASGVWPPLKPHEDCSEQNEAYEQKTKSSYMRQLLPAFCLVILLAGCGKDTADPQAECEVRNYGIYKVNFGSALLNHRVLVVVGFGTRQKDIPAGVLTDTMHLNPGTYSVFITSNSGGPAINSETTSAIITQCNETIKSVSF